MDKLAVPAKEKNYYWYHYGPRFCFGILVVCLLYLFLFAFKIIPNSTVTAMIGLALYLLSFSFIGFVDNRSNLWSKHRRELLVQYQRVVINSETTLSFSEWLKEHNLKD